MIISRWDVPVFCGFVRIEHHPPPLSSHWFLLDLPHGVLLSTGLAGSFFVCVCVCVCVCVFKGPPLRVDSAASVGGVSGRLRAGGRGLCGSSS